MQTIGRYILHRIQIYSSLILVTAVSMFALLFFGKSVIAILLGSVVGACIMSAEITMYTLRQELVKNGIDPETLKYNVNKEDREI